MVAMDQGLRLLDSMIRDAVEAGVGQRDPSSERLSGRIIRIKDRKLLNFASSSYLGLELDPRVIEGAASAVAHHGARFSDSPDSFSTPVAYAKLEMKLSSVFEAHAIAAPTTALGHLAALPVLIGERDAALLDHHVHHSVQSASTHLSAFGTRVDVVRHHDVAMIEERLADLCQRHERVWVLIDGVSSMFGDLAPLDELEKLLDRYEQLHLYIDDSHGTSWCGANGCGYALTRLGMRPRLVLATNLGKAFGAAGSALLLDSSSLEHRIRTQGATALCRAPIQPPMLGAALASATIHLSHDIARLQERHAALSKNCERLLAETDLPVVSDPRSPIQYIEVGLPRMAQQLARHLMDDGLFVNVAQFPAVPMERAGIRFSLTLHHEHEDLHRLIESMQFHYQGLVGSERAKTVAIERSVARAWEEGESASHEQRSSTTESLPGGYRIERADTIAGVPEADWDRCLGARGSFSWRGLQLLERIFRHRDEPENRWGFHYYRILDAQGRTQLATFFTSALWKTDMLAPENVSRQAEEARKHDPLFLTDHVFGMGSLLTTGNHLYLDPALGEPGSEASRSVLELLLSAIQHDAQALGCTTIALRDLEDPECRLETIFRQDGFYGMPLPDCFELENDWHREEDFLSGLAVEARHFQRDRVAPFDDVYHLEVLSSESPKLSAEDLEHLYTLYRELKERSLAINTFDLPRDFIASLLDDESWELLVLRQKAGERRRPGNRPVAFAACFKGSEQYVPMVIGLDERLVKLQGLKRQCVRHIVRRAQLLGFSRICFGMGNATEMRGFGARPQRRFAFLQSADDFNRDAVAQMAIDAMDYGE